MMIIAYQPTILRWWPLLFIRRKQAIHGFPDYKFILDEGCRYADSRRELRQSIFRSCALLRRCKSRSTPHPQAENIFGEFRGLLYFGLSVLQLLEHSFCILSHILPVIICSLLLYRFDHLSVLEHQQCVTVNRMPRFRSCTFTVVIRWRAHWVSWSLNYILFVVLGTSWALFIYF